MKKSSWVHDPTIIGNPLIQYIQLCIYLFIFWLFISGTFHLKFILIGTVTSLVVAWVCMPILTVRNSDHTKKYFVLSVPFHKVIVYCCWLLKELILANIDVAACVWKKKVAIDPIIIKFEIDFDNPMAITMLANSITLTPGTITLECSNEIFEVHALTPAAAQGLRSGNMVKKIAALYHESDEFNVIEEIRRLEL